MKRSSNIFTRTLLLLFTGLSLMTAAGAQIVAPTPYSSPLFHAGGTSPDPLAPLIPGYGQLQGTPSALFGGISTEVPSFLLGNYNPLQPPAGATTFFPNHFRDGTINSWSAPFTFLSIPPAVSPSVLGTFSTTTIVTASANPIGSGSSITYTAQVTEALGTGPTPTGSVKITVGGTTSAALPLSAAGVATFTTAALTTGGANTVSAVYTPSGSFLPSDTSGHDLTEVVNTGNGGDRVVIVTADVNPTQPSGSVTFTGTIYDGNGGTLAGPPTLTIDGVDSGPSPVTIASLSAGPHRVTSSAPVPTIPAPFYQVVNGLSGLNPNVQSTPTAINATEYPEITNAKYFGATAGSTNTPDVVPFTGSASPLTAADPAHAIRQLVYFGRSEYVLDTRALSPTVNRVIHVGAVYCVNGFTGEVVWRYQTATVAQHDPSVFSSPTLARLNVITDTAGTVIANKLVVLVGDNNGFVYCLDAVGNGDGTSNSDSVDTAYNQPIYETARATALGPTFKAVGTAGAYWVYRPDALKPLTATGTAAPVDVTANIPVPRAFGIASPNVYIDPAVATAAPTATNSTIYLGNTNGVLYALDGLGVPNTAPSVHYSTSLALTAISNTVVAATPTANPLWWFWPGGSKNPDVSTEVTPAIIQPVAPATVPTVCIGTSAELGLNTNAGRLYSINGVTGPAGPTGPATPGAVNYNIDQRPLWAFPNRYLSATPGTNGNVGGLGIRPALGNLSGSPVIFSNKDDLVGGVPRTRIYFAANSGVEVPYVVPPAVSVQRDPDARAAAGTTGRVWAVNTDGTTATTVGGTTNIWAYPLAQDPNDKTKDRTPEPSPPIGSFLHATPAMGFVQFPTTITNGDGTAYTHKDSANTTDIKGKSVPMLYIGTQGSEDIGFYALDVNGFDDATRDIYRIESPTGAAFTSSPALVTNSSVTGGNGGAVYATAGNSLFQFGATPITNLNTAQTFPFISVDKTFTGFGPVSSPTPAAADVSDLTTSGLLPSAYTGKNTTDWIYVGDGTTGFCRGITPIDPNYGGIVPPANYGGVIDSAPPDSIDARYPLRTFLFDGTSHPGNSTDMNSANPPGGKIAVFEWGQYSYIRVANVVPPFNGTGNPPLALLVQDPNDPAGTTYYGNGSAVTFKIGDVSDANTYAPATTIPSVILPALNGAATDNGFIKRTGPDRSDEPLTSSLKDTAIAAGHGWIAAYSYPIGSYRTRSGDTPGARRHVTEAHQTANTYTYDGTTVALKLGANGLPLKLTLDALSLQGNQSAVGPVGSQTIVQSPATVQPTFGILNPLALRGAGVPYALNGAMSATELGDAGGVGPFRAVDPSLPAGPDLQALTNGNSVYTIMAPNSGYDANGIDPTQASVNRTADATNYPKAYKFIATSLGQVRDGSTGDNNDSRNLSTPPGTYTPGSNGLSTLPIYGYGSGMLNVADRSLLGIYKDVYDPLNLSQKLFPPYPIAMQRASAHWNDNTGLNGPGACVNRLPWEELPSAVSANTSRDYPDIAAAAIKHTLITNAGTTQEITGRRTESTTEQILDPANPGTDDQHRIIVLDPIKITMDVPKYQPANLQVWDASQYQTSTGVTNTTNTQAAIPPDRINSSHTIFPEGYVEGAGGAQRVFIDLNHNGICDNNEPYRDVQVFSGVAVNMTTSLAGGTVDVGSVPSSFGVQTDLYTPLAAFSPYNPAYQTEYLPVTAYNDGNVNLLNVHFDQKISSSPQTLLLNSDTLDPSSYIPAFDYSTVGISGPSAAPGRYLLRSSLDTDLLGSGRNPLVVGGGLNDPVTSNSISGQFPSYTFHKPRVGVSATTLTVPDSPDNGSSYDVATSANNLPASGSKALPFVSIAVPFGTPSGDYSQTMRLFEGIDVSGYSTYNGNNQPYNPLYPPQYGGGKGGLDIPGSVPGGTPFDEYQVGQQPLSDPGVTVKTSVLEDRLTDGLTYGAIPQVDIGQSGPIVGGNPTSTPDFAPAAFQAVGGNLSLFWTSGRAASGFGIYGALATYVAPAYLPYYPTVGTPSWFAPNSPTTLIAGTNSGLTIAQEAPYLSGGVFTSDAALAFAFAVNVNTAPYQNSLYCYPVTPNSGVLGAAQLVTSDPAQVKYGVRGVYCPGASFPGNSNLWAFWTGSTRGRTAIYYNSREAGTGNWPNNTRLLPIPAGLTAVSDAAPMLISAPITAANGTVTLNKMIEVTFSGTAADGNSDLYACRYLPVFLNGSNVPELVLQSFSQVTEQLKPIGGWLQARDVAWSRAAGVNILVGGVGVLYDTATGNSLFKNVTFDRASGLLVYTGVSLTPVTPNTFTNTLYVDISTGRVRFVTIPTGAVTATFTPQARRITEDSRADTGVVTFLDPTFKSNEGPGLGRVQADRRWYFWRKSGVSDDTTSATLYQKSQRLTAFLPKPVDVTKAIKVTVGGAAYSGSYDVFNLPKAARIYFPILSGGLNEGQTVTVGYTATDGTSVTTPQDEIQWQDEALSNDTSAVQPTDAISGLATIVDTKVTMSKQINDNNVAAFLDTNAYLFNVPGGTASTDVHKIWLFWNSTRNGTADLYYETINPRFTANGP